MKKFTKIFFAVAALAVGFSCTTDSTEDLQVELKGQTTLTLSLKESRTQLGEKADGLYPIYWSKGDKIAVNGVASTALTAEEAGSALAKFTFESELARPYSIVYPAPAEGVTALTEGQCPVTFLAEQAYTAGTFCAGAAPMYGYAAALAEGEEAAPIQLNHLTGVISLAPKGEGVTLSKVVITSERGDLAGTYDVNCSTGALTPQEGKTSKQIVLSFADGLALGAEATPIYVTVPAGDYGAVLATLHTTTGEKMTVKFDSDAKPITAGTVREFAEFLFVANTNDTSDVFEIYDVADMLTFAKIAPTFYPRTEAKVMAEIDMTGVEWVPVKDFAYTFNGNNQIIKGLSAPLFRNTNGTIKDLTLTAIDQVWSEPYTEQFNHAGTIVCDLHPGGELINCSAEGKVVINNTTYNAPVIEECLDFNFGGLVGYAPGTTITNCVSDVDITVKSLCSAEVGATTAYELCAGGVVGFVNNGLKAKFSHLTNKGDLTWEVTNTENSSSGTQTIYLCGVVGRSYAANDFEVFEHITNEGNIIATKESNRRGDICALGIIGWLYTGPTSADYLINKGNITVNGTGKAIYATGFSYTLFTPYSNCYNEGDITVSGTATSTICAMGHTVRADSYGKKANNYNTGNISLLDGTSTTKEVYVAGIVGDVKCSNATDGVGSHENCYNSGKITVGKITTGGRIYVGGLFSRMYFGSAINCINKESAAITINAENASAEIICGGIVGFLDATKTYANQHIDLTDCTNNAAVTLNPTKCVGVHVGGAVGCNYTTLATNVTTLTRVNNYGAVTAGGVDWDVTFGDQAVGGVIGFLYNHATLDDCHNYGEVKANPTSTLKNLYMGGIYAYSYQKTANRTIKINKCSNEAKITYSPSTVTNYAFAGGILGRMYGATTTMDFDETTNSGEIEINGESLQSAVMGSFAGIIQLKSGTFDNCHTYEHDIKINTKTFVKPCSLGWIGLYEHKAEKLTSYFKSCSSASDWTIPNLEAKSHIYACNFVGRNAWDTDTYLPSYTEINDCHVTGDWNFNGTVGGDTFYGGLLGYPYGGNANYTFNNCTTSGDVTITGTFKGTACLSPGLAGYASARMYATNVKNSGDIVFDGTHEKGYISFGGLYSTMNSAYDTFTSVANTGNITISGNFAGNITAGGLAGYNKQSFTMENAYNSGTITVGSDTKSVVGGGNLTVGGLFGFNEDVDLATYNGTITNIGDITVKNTEVAILGTSAIGGAAGHTITPINNADAYCNISAVGFTRVGMISGVERIHIVTDKKGNSTTYNCTATNCKAGGTICTKSSMGEAEDGSGDEIIVNEVITLDESNFYDYIYAGTTDWTGVENYDGCSFLSVVPEV